MVLWNPFLPEAGLWSLGDLHEPIPLRNVTVTGSIVDFAAQFTLNQTYHNPTPCALKTEYIFPLEPGCAVSAFRAVLGGGETVEGVIRKKQQAEEEYEQAVRTHHRAAQLKKVTGDVFRCSIGNIQPDESVEIQLEILVELRQEGEHTVFTLPTFIAPRYGRDPTRTKPAINVKESKEDEEVDEFTVLERLAEETLHAQPNRKRCHKRPREDVPSPTSAVSETRPFPSVKRSPPARLLAGLLPYRLELELKCAMATDVVNVFSSSHDLWVESDAPSHEFSCGLLTPTPLDYPFVLCIQTATPFLPRLTVESTQTTPPHTVAQLAFCAPSVDNVQATTLPCEVIFVVDRSGSMRGTRLDTVKQTLKIFLRSLPTQSRFNIVSFSEHSNFLFKEGSQPYTNAAVRKATSFVERLRANGGTKLGSCLRKVLKTPSFPSHPRQLFVLTDGCVWNTKAVLNMCHAHRQHARVFTFGIGEGASRELCLGMARAGHGEAVFVFDADTIATKVLQQLNRALQPAWTDIRIDWSQLTGEQTIAQCPLGVPPVYPGSLRFVYLWDLNPTLLKRDGRVEVSFFSRHEPKTVHVPLTNAVQRTGQVVHKMAAAKRVQELEDTLLFSHLNAGEAKRVETQIETLGLLHSLATRCTSFVAVHHESCEPLPQKEVAVALPKREVGIRVDLWEDMQQTLHNAKRRWSSSRSRSRSPKRRCTFGLGSARESVKRKRCRGGAVQKQTRHARKRSRSPLQQNEIRSLEWMEMREPKKVNKRAFSFLPLVELQDVAGFWELREDVCNRVGVKVISKDALIERATKAKLAFLEHVSEAEIPCVVVTLLVLHALQTQHAKHSLEWQLVAAKARRWLGLQLKKDEAAIEGMVENIAPLSTLFAL